MNWLSKLSRGLSGVVTLISPSCKEVTRLQSQAMDRRLSLVERCGLRLHLLLCKWCRRYGIQLKFLRVAAHQCEEPKTLPSPQGLSPEARERIKQKLQSSQK
jgi:hypothetical protein